ncbi:MAG: hypothetical protein K8R54_05355 [Bacteroidales bacterium]|nr:hypothetical protein [Bacteroidales bacterium]
MIVETVKNETLIRIPKTVDSKIVQSVIDYLRIVEILMNNKGNKESAEQLAEETDKNWWNKNKNRFIK